MRRWLRAQERPPDAVRTRASPDPPRPVPPANLPSRTSGDGSSRTQKNQALSTMCDENQQGRGHRDGPWSVDLGCLSGENRPPEMSSYSRSNMHEHLTCAHLTLLHQSHLEAAPATLSWRLSWTAVCRSVHAAGCKGVGSDTPECPSAHEASMLPLGGPTLSYPCNHQRSSWD